MSYYQVLGLSKEPFSTSPDPGFFFLSREHKAALCRLQVAIKLKRGLSVVLGDVGTGKTTLSRTLARVLNAEPGVNLHMTLNPLFETEAEFLRHLARQLRTTVPDRASGLVYMEAVESVLFRLAVEEQKTVILLIDEAQMLPDFVLEILRILLNYETNEHKILQLVLVGQMELLPRIRGMENFWDRIALKYVLKPLDEGEVRALIGFRLRQAGFVGHQPLFTSDALRAVYEETGGYPRRVAVLCHNVLEWLVMHDRRQADHKVVCRVVADELRPFGWERKRGTSRGSLGLGDLVDGWLGGLSRAGRGEDMGPRRFGRRRERRFVVE